MIQIIDDMEGFVFLRDLIESLALGHSINHIPHMNKGEFPIPVTPVLYIVRADLHSIIQFSKEIRHRTSHHPDVKILALLMEELADDDYESLRQAGVSDFTPYPFHVGDFKFRIEGFLHYRAISDEYRHAMILIERREREALRKSSLRERELILRLSRAAELKDEATGGHIMRMASYSHIVAQSLGLDRETCHLIKRAAPMHDIGKIGIPDAILHKPSALLEEEMAIMRTHTTIGYDILRDSTSPLMQIGAEIALSHHEKWNGGGYPFGISHDAIPLSACIIAVADVFDALTTIRPYKPSWSVEDASRHIERLSGEHFSPICVDAFLSSIREIKQVHHEYHGP